MKYIITRQSFPSVVSSINGVCLGSNTLRVCVCYCRSVPVRAALTATLEHHLLVPLLKIYIYFYNISVFDHSNEKVRPALALLFGWNVLRSQDQESEKNNWFFPPVLIVSIWIWRDKGITTLRDKNVLRWIGSKAHKVIEMFTTIVSWPLVIYQVNQGF